MHNADIKLRKKANVVSVVKCVIFILTFYENKWEKTNIWTLKQNKKNNISKFKKRRKLNISDDEWSK